MKEKVQKLVGYIMAKDYGEIIYHQEVAKQIGEKPKTPRYFSIITGAKKILLESGHMIKSVRKSGYQVVEPDDYTNHAVSQVMAGAKKIDSGVNIMRHTPVANMTPEGIASYNRTNDQIQNLQAFMAGKEVEIKMLSTPRQHPLRQF